MILLGSGLGLAVVSPWSGDGVSATTFAVSAAVWLVVIQWVASLFGGYVTGRLRTKWVGVHTDEVFFRDTAHGFVTWCVATGLVAVLLASGTSGIVSKGVQATATVAAGAVQGVAQADPTAYFVDTLFRPTNPSPTASGADSSTVRGEVSRILLTGVSNGEISADDKTYLVTLIGNQAGLAPADAQKRVDGVLAQIDAAKVKAKEAADAARKSGLTASLLGVVALLIGAFIASVAAAYAGRLRDADVPDLT
jgi:hypothetical protein